jgi:predicted secreted protein
VEQIITGFFFTAKARRAQRVFRGLNSSRTFLISLIHVYLLPEILMKRLSLLLIGIVFLIGCTPSTSTPTPTLPPTEQTPNPLPEPSDPTQLILVKAGETFELVLSSNPSTGYQWKVIPELDETIVELVGQEYIAEQPVAPGSGGMDVWMFRARNAGETTIVLGYYPPDLNSEPEETITFSIQVE